MITDKNKYEMCKLTVKLAFLSQTVKEGVNASAKVARQLGDG